MKSGERLFIGTSGFSFQDWKGNFYPAKLPQNRWLEFYISHFTTLEINATYYRLPNRSFFESIVDRTPENYPVWVKIPGEVTHRDGDEVQWMELFRQATAPLAARGRFAGALAQFPSSFRPTVQSKELLHRLKSECCSTPLAVEIRHEAWQTADNIEYFRREDIINVIPDLPVLKGLPNNQSIVTSSVAYIRFHGKNQLTWNNPQAGDRYDYEYSEYELNQWIPKIAELQAVAETTFIFFNNCHMGQAVKNARMLMALLEHQSGSSLF